jgi:type II secretory pathway pseudopilin PulG
MSRFARHVGQRLGDERGIAMILVVVTTVVLSVLAAGLLSLVGNEQKQSANAVTSQQSFQAAEAGLDDYLAKIIDDRLYFLHQVHPAESTRRPPSGVDVAGGSAWPYANTWTYPTPKNNWKALPNGYEYNLQVTPPTAGQTTTTILATGRKTGSTTGARAVQVQVRPSSLADFYRFSDADVPYGAGAVLNGKVYANGQVTNGDSGAVVANADIYAWGGITGNFSMQSGSKKYTTTTTPSITTKFKSKIDFSRFLVSFTDLSRAAQAGGVYLNDATKNAWRLDFASNGTFTAKACTSGSDVAKVAPTCGSATTYNVPTNGAIYTGQTAIVAGQVKGRVTVGSNDDIVIGNNIAPVAPGTDVLGLVAYNDLWIADYSQDPLTWSASLLVQTNTWHTTSGAPGKSTMTFTGSAATAKGGGFAFTNRNYDYDDSLQYLQPPWFPVLDDFLVIGLFREVPAG